MGVVAAAPRTAAGRVPALGGAAVVCAGVAAACGRRVLELVAGVAGAGPDELVELAVLAAGAIVLAWLAGSAALATTCLLVRRAGRVWRHGEAWVHRCAPAVVRRALVLAIAAGLGAASVTTASAADLAPATSPTPTATAVVLGGAGPDLGWVVTGPGTPTARAVAAAPSATVLAPVTTSSAPAVTPSAAAPVATQGALTPGAWRPGSAPATGTEQDAPAVPHAERSTPAPRSAAVGGTATVVVVRGDTLWDIAARHLPDGASAADVAAAWPAWYAANAATIGPEPGLILPGQVLVAPSGVAR